jgi:putative ABC transport system permease protein
VGRLKAAGGTPGVVALILLAEHLLIAVVAAVAGLTVGSLLTPLLSSAGAGLVGAPGAPSLTLGIVGIVFAVALGVTLAATLVPALRAARTSTISALANAARPPRRRPLLIAISAHLPASLLIGIRVTARRQRRGVLVAASTAIMVMGITAVMAAHRADDVLTTRGDWFAGLPDPVTGRVSQVMVVLTVVLVALAAVNAVITGWATAVDARTPSALSRALGGTPRQVSMGLAIAQTLPVLPGALTGIPLGVLLYTLANGSGQMLVPPLPWLVWTILATLAAMAALTAIPASFGARQPVAPILQADAA